MPLPGWYKYCKARWYIVNKNIKKQFNKDLFLPTKTTYVFMTRTISCKQFENLQENKNIVKSKSYLYLYVSYEQNIAILNNIF